MTDRLNLFVKLVALLFWGFAVFTFSLWFYISSYICFGNVLVSLAIPVFFFVGSIYFYEYVKWFFNIGGSS